MTAASLAGHLGTTVDIDLCHRCQVFWFDGYESLKLAPASVLTLFRIIGEGTAATRHPIGSTSVCPRCGMRLRPTHDLQRTTKFEYLRCPAGHGRLITFFDFLREKDFIRPLSPKQIEELRRNVQVVNCSNCGAPIDLSTGTACGHCGSPLSMLDLSQAETIVHQLREAARPATRVDPALPLDLERARREVSDSFAAFEHDDRWFTDVSSFGLVGAGLTALSRWLKKQT
jgi:hypothetical protein